MSDYFDSSQNRVPIGSLAKSEQVNNLRDEVGLGFDELPPPDVINQGRVTFAEDTGTANQYELTLASTVTAYETYLTVNFIPAHNNTGASTVNVNGLGAIAIKDNDGDDVSAGTLITTGVNSLTYNGTHFVLAGVTSATLEGLVGEAEDARDLAVTSASNASTSETNTDNDASQTASDRIQTGLDRVQTTADAVATAADRVQTGLDRTASSGSASDASDSADDAAASASSIDVAKLAGIEDNATTDQTDAEILTAVNNNAGVTLSGVNTGDQTTITGNAGTATALQTARTIDITGDITATAVAFDGTANIAISASVDDDSHSHTASTLPAVPTFDDTAHGSRAGGSLHAVATQSVAGFMSASDKTRVDGLLTYGGVGTYVIAYGNLGAEYNPNSTIAGSSLRYVNADGGAYGGLNCTYSGISATMLIHSGNATSPLGLTGTWQCMTRGGSDCASTYRQAHLWVRIV